MNGPEHFANAQDQILAALGHFSEGRQAEGEFVIQVAQTHALLALALSLGHLRGEVEAVRDELAGLRQDLFLRGGKS